MRKTLLIMAITAMPLAGCTLGNIMNNHAMDDIGSLAQARAVVSRGMSMEQVQAKFGAPSARTVHNAEATWFAF